MPGGKHDSSKTRVKPVFDQLWRRGRDWLPDLLALPTGGSDEATVGRGDLTLLEGHWAPKERCLDPPVGLLSWLIRNMGAISTSTLDNKERQLLAEGQPDTIREALTRLRSDSSTRGWHILEGPTCPDVFLVAPDAIVVIEGKRTEMTITADTKWLKGRHQIWRHLDAAWELRGRRAVYGFFIVESDAASIDGKPNQHWTDAGRECLSREVLRTSFPHRSEDEALLISRCYLGVTTWRRVCERFAIDWRSLPDEV